MKTFLLVLLIFAFLQSAFLPFNMVLVLLTARSLGFEDRENLIVAFIIGLALSFLTQVNLGYWPIILICVVKLLSFIRKLPVSFGPVVVFLSGVIIILGLGGINALILDDEFKILSLLAESLLVVPAFYLIKLWEERFIVKNVMKLKV